LNFSCIERAVVNTRVVDQSTKGKRILEMAAADQHIDAVVVHWAVLAHGRVEHAVHINLHGRAVVRAGDQVEVMSRRRERGIAGGIGRAPKLQAPSTKLQRSSKSQAPNQARRMWSPSRTAR